MIISIICDNRYTIAARNISCSENAESRIIKSYVFTISIIGISLSTTIIR